MKATKLPGAIWTHQATPETNSTAGKSFISPDSRIPLFNYLLFTEKKIKFKLMNDKLCLVIGV